MISLPTSTLVKF
ncbi:hypothetical protein LINPERHAP2_LOCUS20943 [Linum perenne]